MKLVRFVVASIIIVAVLCVESCWCLPKPKTRSTIAVPKFLNITKDASVEWLSGGFAETLTTKLAGISGLQLVERARLSEALKELKLQSSALADPSSAKKLGQLVGAEYVIVGSFQRVGDKIRADVRQIQVETGKVKGAADVAGPYDSVLELQSELAKKLIGILGRSASASESARLATPETLSVAAFEWNSRGNAQLDRGLYSEAIVSFTRALQLDGKYVSAYYNRALAQHGLSDLASAIADYSACIELNPAFVNAYNNRGVAYNESGNRERALADFNEGLKRAKNSPDLLNNRANYYKLVKDYDKALADYNLAIKLQPKDPVLYYNRGNVYFIMGKCGDAQADYSSAIELNPGYEQAFNNRGSCMSRQGLCAQALADYKKAVSLNPEYATPYYNMALELENAGKAKEAVEAYRKYVRFASGGQNDRIQKALQKLQQLTKK